MFSQSFHMLNDNVEEDILLVAAADYVQRTYPWPCKESQDVETAV